MNVELATMKNLTMVLPKFIAMMMKTTKMKKMTKTKMMMIEEDLWLEITSRESSAYSTGERTRRKKKKLKRPNTTITTMAATAQLRMLSTLS